MLLAHQNSLVMLGENAHPGVRLKPVSSISLKIDQSVALDNQSAQQSQQQNTAFFARMA